MTGGEPFLLAEIGEILAACTTAAPTTVLTNGMLLAGRRLESLRALPRERLALQISLDSPTPEPNDRHRGKGTWVRACSDRRTRQIDEDRHDGEFAAPAHSRFWHEFEVRDAACDVCKPP